MEYKWMRGAHMHIRAAACDDEKHFIEEIAAFGKNYSLTKEHTIEIDCFTNPQKLLKVSETKDYDILFLDIEMPGIDGITLAKKIKERNEDALFIFVTSHNNFAYDAAQIEAFGYFPKPANEFQFVRYMDRAVLVFQGIKEQMILDNQYLDIIVDYDKIQLHMKEIIVIEKQRNSVIITTKAGREYKHYITIKKLEEKLNKKRFIRISSSCIINMEYVKDVACSGITMQIAGKEQCYSVNRKTYSSIKNEIKRFQLKKQ